MFLSIFFRSFLIQAGWNYERFQNLGFAFSVFPALKKIYPAGEKLNSAVSRHLAIFNTQPYMSGFVLGNVIKMEEELAAGPGEAAEKKLLGVKQALASGFASVGDRIFWGRLKPMTTLFCIMCWMLSGFWGWLFTDEQFQPSLSVLLTGPLLGIAIYGAFSVYLRWRGLGLGYACGGKASCGLESLPWTLWIRALSVTGFALALAISLCSFAYLSAHYWELSFGDLVLKAVPAFGAVAAQRLARKMKKSIFFAMASILAASAVFFYVKETGNF